MTRRKSLVTGAAAGVLAAGAALYIAGFPGGNAAQAEPVEIAEGIVETPACVLDGAARGAIERATTGEVAAMQVLDRGISLATLPFEGPDGAAMTLADLGDGTKLLNLWATWCAPCRAEMPHLDELAKEGAAEGSLTVVALNVDTGDADKPKRFLDEIGVENLPLYREPTMQAFSGLRLAELAVGLPVTALIDGEGCVLAAMNGPAVWNSPDAKALIAAANALGR